MTEGRKGMGNHKHGISGHSGKSPKMRFQMKLDAEKNERKDKSRIREPKNSVHDLFREKNQ